MKRLMILIVFGVGMLFLMMIGAGTFFATRKLGGNAGPALRELGVDLCDRFLAGMPESFPPNQMMADLDTLKERTGRILELVEGRKEAEEPPKKARPRRTKAS